MHDAFQLTSVHQIGKRFDRGGTGSEKKKKKKRVDKKQQKLSICVAKRGNVLFFLDS
jgi:hypothetical protein